MMGTNNDDLIIKLEAHLRHSKRLHRCITNQNSKVATARENTGNYQFSSMMVFMSAMRALLSYEGTIIHDAINFSNISAIPTKDWQQEYNLISTCRSVLTGSRHIHFRINSFLHIAFEVHHHVYYSSDYFDSITSFLRDAINRTSESEFEFIHAAHAIEALLKEHQAKYSLNEYSFPPSITPHEINSLAEQLILLNQPVLKFIQFLLRINKQILDAPRN